MTSITRERSKDTDAGDSTIDDNLDELTKRRDRARAAQGGGGDEPAAQAPGYGGARRDLDAEARPRELDFSAPDMPRKRRH
jgi:hypothetical protein